MKKKVYIISGLGAGTNVFDRITFGQSVEPVFIPWLIPKTHETMEAYCDRMAAAIDISQPFYLIGYSFGGMVVQEINKKKHAEKVILMGCVREAKEMSLFFKFLKYSHLYQIVPTSFFTSESKLSYVFFRELYDRKGRLPRLFDYFTVRDHRYLKWSLRQTLNWKGKKQDNVIQIMAQNDAVFPIKNSKPDYVIDHASHLFAVTKANQVSAILQHILV